MAYLKMPLENEELLAFLDSTYYIATLCFDQFVLCLPFASDSAWTEFDQNPIFMCHLSEELLVIVKECFPANSYILSTS